MNKSLKKKLNKMQDKQTVDRVKEKIKARKAKLQDAENKNLHGSVKPVDKAKLQDNNIRNKEALKKRLQDADTLDITEAALSELIKASVKEVLIDLGLVEKPALPEEFENEEPKEDDDTTDEDTKLEDNAVIEELNKPEKLEAVKTLLKDRKAVKKKAQDRKIIFTKKLGDSKPKKVYNFADRYESINEIKKDKLQDGKEEFNAFALRYK